MLPINFDVLREAGCIQCESEDLRKIFLLLMLATKCDPCTTGCPAFHGGKCKVYQRYHSTENRRKQEKKEQHKRATTPNNGTGKWAGMTMKRIAKAEGISLNEARRRKAAGKYNRGE